MFGTDRKRLSAMVLAAVGLTAVAAATKAEVQSLDGRVHMHFDTRFSHNEFYHDLGWALPGVPRGAYLIHHGGDIFFYHGGEWYRRRGRLSVVVAAPVGAFAPVLPPFHTTVCWRGEPYYYADDTYYRWNAGAKEYEVVTPSAGIESAGTIEAPADLIRVAANEGQSADQQAQDRYQCRRSAVLTTGDDPSANGESASKNSAANEHAAYVHTEATCLEARGYTVKPSRVAG